MVSMYLRHFLCLPRYRLCLRHLSRVPYATQDLLDLGFSEEQIGRLQSLKSTKGDPQHRLACIKELLLLGIDSEKTLQMLEARPELFRLSGKELRDRTENLRRLGLGEGSLQVALSRCPSLLSVPRTRIQATVQCLKLRCQFSTQQVAKILHTYPEALTQDPDYLEEIFQYVYFRMGGKHKEILTSGLFVTSLDEVKVRHQFLERLGRFQPPNKKGECLPSNPKLKDVIKQSEKDFLSNIACSTQAELNVFRKILAQEESEARERNGNDGDETDSENEEEDSDNDRDGSDYDDDTDEVNRYDPEKSARDR
ncbi:transcription termination factor 4, mitochondrial isoform X2 [Spea bombifrons]|uniref:transcription termination factor 4, mitochondrial isoform X2 n=1 Tax=Spea bombifrons TaxID=233779 RepID=UPI00234B22B3|nr:transcription termination factor 4, mitochondrial isoform X2 [Spea bombifrons]